MPSARSALALAPQTSSRRVQLAPVVCRSPRGYVGRGHETIGSDILAVLKILRSPAAVLGEDEATQLQNVRPSQWYPIDRILLLMDQLDQSIGHYGLLNMGRKLFDLSHRARVLNSAHSAHDILYGVDAMYRHSNRGIGIGGWTVVRFAAGYAELEKTTPHNCIMEQGLIAAGLSAMGTPGIIAQTRCMLRGDDHCLFVISSAFTDERWFGYDAP